MGRLFSLSEMDMALRAMKKKQKGVDAAPPPPVVHVNVDLEPIAQILQKSYNRNYQPSAG